MKKSFLLIFTFMTMISIALVGCGSDDSSGNGDNGDSNGGDGDTQDTLIYGRGADATRLDPATVTDGESLKVTQQVMETLINFKPGTTELEEGLATDWEEKDEGKTYEFELREDVKFHDGTDFDADAVVYNFERWQEGDEDDDNFSYYPSMFGGFGDESAIKDVEATDDYTVEFHFDEPFSPFLKNLAMTPFAIASPEALEEEGSDEFEKHPVGTGPFEFDEWDKDNKIVLKKNEDYRDEDKPKLNEIIFRVIDDNSSRLNALKSGEIDLMDGTNPSDVESIEEEDGLEVYNRPPLSMAYFGFNVEEEPFDDEDVRVALNHAVDKESLIDAFYAGKGEAAKNPMPPTVDGYNDDIQPYEYDPEKAKEMLEDAGYEDLEMDLWTFSNPRPYLPEPEKIAENIQSSFGEAGVDVNIETYEWSTYVEKVTDGEAPAFLMGWTGDNGDADNFIYSLLDEDAIGSNNNARYANDEVHELLTGAQTEADDDARNDLYKEAQEIIHDEAPWIPIIYSEEPLAANDNLQDYEPNPTGSEPFDEVSFKE